MSRQFVPPPSRGKRTRILIIALLLVAIFLIPPVRNAVRSVVYTIGISIGHGANGVGGWFGSIKTSLASKHTLEEENRNLKIEIDELNTRMTDYNVLVSENAELKETLGRTGSARFTLAAVIQKPPHSLYDSLIIDGGEKLGFRVGQIVFANGATPIGVIEEVHATSALVKLYSAPSVALDARLSIPGGGAGSNIDVTITGRGGGNFTAIVPHDTDVVEGTTIVTKEIHPYVVAVFQKVTSDPRDPFKAFLLRAPVNMNELTFVQVRED